MVTRETIWAVLGVHQRRSVMALAAIMVLHSERYRHLASVPWNQGLKPALVPGILPPPPGTGWNTGGRKIALTFWDNISYSEIVLVSGCHEMVHSDHSKTGFIRSSCLSPRDSADVKIISTACINHVHLIYFILSLNCWKSTSLKKERIRLSLSSITIDKLECIDESH